MEHLDNLRDRQSPLDKHGTCPECNTNWDAGEILDTLARLNVFSGKTLNDVAKVANSYGWTQLNQARFSNVIIIMLPVTPIRREVVLYQCHKCMSIFDRDTGEKFHTLTDAKNHYNNGSDNNQLLDNDQEQATEGLAAE